MTQFAAVCLTVCVLFGVLSVFIEERRIKTTLVAFMWAALCLGVAQNVSAGSGSASEAPAPAPVVDSTVCLEEFPAQHLSSTGTLGATALAIMRLHCPEQLFNAAQAEEMARAYSGRLRMRHVHEAMSDLVAFATEIAEQACDGVCVPPAERDCGR